MPTNRGSDTRVRPWREATKVAGRWLRAIPARATIAVVVGPQPDGIAAAAVLRVALRRAGWSPVLMTPTRGATAWEDRTVDRIAATHPAAVIAAGVGGPSDWPHPVPLLALDHRPMPPAPADVTAISAADWAPPTSTSGMAYWLTQGVANIRRLDWVAALGVQSVLGESTEHALVTSARKAHGGGALHDLLVLIRAASRATEPATGAAVGLLSSARDPKDALLMERPELSQVLAARDDLEAAIDGVRDTPALSVEPIVLVRAASPCLVHSVLATVWRSRQPDRPVLVGNDLYLPGRVAFAAVGLPDLPTERFASALVDQATIDDPIVARHMATGDWLRLLRQLGVPGGIWSRPNRTSSGRRAYV